MSRDGRGLYRHHTLQVCLFHVQYAMGTGVGAGVGAGVGRGAAQVEASSLFSVDTTTRSTTTCLLACLPVPLLALSRHRRNGQG